MKTILFNFILLFVFVCSVKAQNTDSLNHITDWKYLITKADSLKKTSQYNEAIDQYQKALQLAKYKINNDSIYVRSCIFLGLLYKEQGQYIKAEPLLLKANTIQQLLFGKSDPQYANSCNALAIIKLIKG